MGTITVKTTSSTQARRKEKIQQRRTLSVTTRNKSSAGSVGNCNCPEEVRKPNTDYCEAGGCGKPLYYCAECFQFIKMKGDNCSCSWAKNKLIEKQKEKNSNDNSNFT